MSVLIKNFEMPKNCEECPFCDYEFAECLATKVWEYDEKKRYIIGEEVKNTLPHDGKRRDWCPLVLVKTYDEAF